MRRWIPHIHFGGSSDACTRDEEEDREGWYFQVCWFGFTVGLTFGSLYADRRFREEIREQERGGPA